jgi:UDP-glucose 4-epimerase
LLVIQPIQPGIFVVLRYFNVAGDDPQARTGQSTGSATRPYGSRYIRRRR